MVGLQYYHASCIFLTSSDGHWQTVSDYELARLRRQSEKTIASHLIMVIGLALSNETVENAFFMACHLVHRCKSPPPFANASPSLTVYRWVLSPTPRRTARIVEIPGPCGKTRRLADGVDGGGIGAAVAGVADVGFMVNCYIEP